MTLRDKKDCPWQALMDVAYQRWMVKDNFKTTFHHVLINHCDDYRMRVACALGKLNQQSESGGFRQWIENGYAMDSWWLLSECLRHMGPVSTKAWDICSLAMLRVDGSTGTLRYQDEDDHRRGIRFLEMLDGQFKQIADAWHEEVYAWLERHGAAIWNSQSAPSKETPMHLNDLGKEILEINKANGWNVTTPECWNDTYKIPAVLALITSETSEALEAFRHDDKENFAEEMADTLIRVLDCAAGLGIDMDKAVTDKLAKNRTRGYRHGGKRV